MRPDKIFVCKDAKIRKKWQLLVVYSQLCVNNGLKAFSEGSVKLIIVPPVVAMQDDGVV